MHMHVKGKGMTGKEVAYSGIMAALSVICIVLSGVIESNSLFFLAAASFLTGSVQRNTTFWWSAGFSLGCFLLGFVLAPQKLYCFTYLAFAVYVMVAEYFRKRENVRIWLVKGTVYHLLLAAALFLVWKLASFDSFLEAEWIGKLYQAPVLFWIVMVILAEVIWLVFDRAYLFFQNHYGHYLLPGE